MSNPHQVTRDFEAALCEYTGAKYAVTTTSCTMALLLALAWEKEKRGGAVIVTVPSHTYAGVPASVVNAGHGLHFYDFPWEGEYRLLPTKVYDSARRFTSGMFRPGYMRCVSFHWSKILGLSQGGAILHDNDEADAWLRRARFDGRTEGVPANEDQVQYPSWHAYLSPEVSAHGIMKLSLLPRHNADLPNSNYPDLSKMEAFQ
jgi:dTDP-4-amino-4,6-dideoxygalactose transaminase